MCRTANRDARFSRIANRRNWEDPEHGGPRSVEVSGVHLYPQPKQDRLRIVAGATSVGGFVQAQAGRIVYDTGWGELNRQRTLARMVS